MAQVLRLISSVAFISTFLMSDCIPTSEAARGANLLEKYDVVIQTGKNHKGSVSGAMLQIQSEVAGTVLTLDTNSIKIAANRISTFNTTSLAISGDICFVQLQYTGGSASEWSVESIQVTVLDTQKTATFNVNKSFKKLTEALTVDTCKQRQQS